MADDVQINKLTVEVEASASDAVSEIDRLAASLSNLAKNSRLSDTVSNLSKLKTVLAGMDSVKNYSQQMGQLTKNLQGLKKASQIEISLGGTDRIDQQIDSLSKNIEKSIEQLSLDKQNDIFERAMGRLGLRQSKQPLYSEKEDKMAKSLEKSVSAMKDFEEETEKENSRIIELIESIDRLSNKAMEVPEGYVQGNGMNFAELAKKYQQPLDKDHEKDDYPLAEGLDQYNEKAQRLAEAAYESFKKIRESAAEAAPAVQELQTQQAKLLETADGVGKPYQDYVESVEQLRQSIQETTGDIEWYKDAIQGAFMAGDTSGLKALKEDLKEAQESLRSMTEQLQNAEGASRGMNWQGIANGMTALKSAASAVADTFKTYLNGIKTVGSYIGGNFIKNLESGIQKILKFGKSVQRMAMLRVTWSVIKAITSGYQEGVDNLYQYAITQGVKFQQTMDNMASSSLYFKNAIGAAAGVLYNTFLPVLSAIADAAANVANALARMFALLTGASTYQAAVKGVTSYQEAASGAAASTKELQKTLLGIDELNVLPDNGSSGGGSGAATPDYSQMFETLNTGMDDLMGLLEGSDWSGLGEVFAEKLNNAMASIPWDKIQATAQLWATRIYTFLNGAVDALDWALTGTTLGNGLNTALGFMDTIVQGFHWETLGQGIGDAMQSLQNVADWELIGRTWSNGFKALTGTLHGFMTSDFSFDDLRENLNAAIDAAFKNIELDQAAEDLGNFALEVLKTIRSALSAVPWDEIGEALKQIPWLSIMGEALGILWEVTKGLVETNLDTVVFPLLGSKLGTGLGTAIGGLLGGPVGAVIGAAVGTLVGGIGGLLISFLPDLWAAFDEGSVRLGEILAGMITSVIEWGSSVVVSFSEWRDKVGDIFEDFATNVYNTFSTWTTNVKEGFADWRSNVSESVSSWASNTRDSISTWASNTKTSFLGWKNNVVTTIGSWSESVKTKVSSWADETGKNISGWIDDAVSWFSGFKDDSGHIMTDAFNGIKSVIDDLITNAFAWGSDFIGNLIDGIKDAADKLWTTVSGIAEGISSFLHFSVPDKGPLADADTWMPDMMMLFSQGIRANMGEVTGNIQKVAQAVQEAMAGAVDYSGKTPAALYGYGSAVTAAQSAIPAYAQNAAASGSQQSDRELVSIMRQMLALMQQGSETSVIIDGREVFSAVKTQARREQMRTGVNPLL